MRRVTRFAFLSLVIASACDSQPPSHEGDLLVSYFQGGPEAGAILLTITGGPVDNVTATGDQQVSFASPLAGTTRLIVTGRLGTGDLLRLRVPDVDQSASYTVRVEQVADKNTFALIDPALHTFTVHR